MPHIAPQKKLSELNSLRWEVSLTNTYFLANTQIYFLDS